MRLALFVLLVSAIGCVDPEAASLAPVHVTTFEGAGEIYVDARPTDDRRLMLQPGTHVIELRQGNLILAARTIRVRSGEPIEVDLDRQAIAAHAGDAAVPSELEIRSHPSLAETLVDGRHEGVTPVRVVVAPGPHSIALRAEGHDVHEQEISIAPASHVELDVTLAPSLP